MGANIVLNYLGEESEKLEDMLLQFNFQNSAMLQPNEQNVKFTLPELKISGACCVQPPMRMWECGHAVRTNCFGAYNFIIGQNLKRKVQKYSHILQSEYLQMNHVDLTECLQKVRTVTDYDHFVTSKVFGFGTIDNYYDKASSVHRIPKIKTPTFIMMAKDDPIIGLKTIDYDTCQKNPNILLGVTEKGGHLGYFESLSSPNQWFVKPVFEFLNAIK